MGEATTISGPDLAADGYPIEDIEAGDMILGRSGEAPVVLARNADGVFAVGARCTHYGASLGAGVFDGELVFCPLHHSAFSVRTGRAERAPALNPVPTYEVTEKDGMLFVGAESTVSWSPPPISDPPDSIVVVGAGAAGATAVETLREEGYEGPITFIGAETDVPTDRPNLSKDYLDGSAPEDWMPLRSESFYEEKGIDLRLGTLATAIDREANTVGLDDGTTISYGALLLAPGADPIRLPIDGADLPHVFALRSLADSRAIIAAAEKATTAVVMGASFIGLEVAASLRHRNIDVHIVAPEKILLERVLGADLGRFVHDLHVSRGVTFHLGHVASAVHADRVVLDDGAEIPADVVVMGVGVRPAVALAESAGLEVDNGIVVDAGLRTADPHIWAAGDAARYPERRLEAPVRVEHWVLAERHGQVAAQNMLGRGIEFRDSPFFWSQHYDVRINYVGHAERWEDTVVSGSIEDGDALVAYREAGNIRAVASIGRDIASLEAQLAMEADDEAALNRLV